MKRYFFATLIVITIGVSMYFLSIFDSKPILQQIIDREYKEESIKPGSSVESITIAFIGDSGYGDSFRAVLSLIKTEDASAVYHLGDFDYHLDPQGFVSVIDEVLGPLFPYFVAVGNHDAQKWDEYTVLFQDRMERLHIDADDPDWSDEVYSFVYEGINTVFVGQNGNNNYFAQFIDQQFNRAPHDWLICGWHKNQTAMQLGGKGDEMGWDVYESCRNQGAIIVTGHEHSYSRTKTLTNISAQTVDPDCLDPHMLCLGTEKTFVVVSGLGGHSIRDQNRCLPTEYPYGCNQEWASIYTKDQGATYGALFIEFNVGGDSRLAKGYFKNIDGQVIDEFTIKRDVSE